MLAEAEFQTRLECNFRWEEKLLVEIVLVLAEKDFHLLFHHYAEFVPLIFDEFPFGGGL